MVQYIPCLWLNKMVWCVFFDSISAVVSRPLTERKRGIKAADIGFPPGRPNVVNIGPICAFRKYRPRYLKNCLLHPGFAELAHHLKAIDGVEKSFDQCCKENKDVQACTEGKACIYFWVFTGKLR